MARRDRREDGLLREQAHPGGDGFDAGRAVPTRDPTEQGGFSRSVGSREEKCTSGRQLERRSVHENRSIGGDHAQVANPEGSRAPFPRGGGRILVGKGIEFVESMEGRQGASRFADGSVHEKRRREKGQEVPRGEESTGPGDDGKGRQGPSRQVGGEFGQRLSSHEPAHPLRSADRERARRRSAKPPEQRTESGRAAFREGTPGPLLVGSVFGERLLFPGGPGLRCPPSFPRSPPHGGHDRQERRGKKRGEPDEEW